MTNACWHARTNRIAAGRGVLVTPASSRSRRQVAGQRSRGSAKRARARRLMAAHFQGIIEPRAPGARSRTGETSAAAARCDYEDFHEHNANTLSNS